MAWPSAWEGKSCTFTSIGRPFALHVRPPFLKAPTSSFFFVSTEITGSPLARKDPSCRLIYRNWVSRPGRWGPSFVLRFNCSEYPISSKIRATVLSLTGCPRRVSSSASASVDWLVHRRALIGSPAVVSSTIRVSSARSRGSTSSTFFRPARPDPSFRPGFQFPSPRQLGHGPGERRSRHPGQFGHPANSASPLIQSLVGGEQPRLKLVQGAQQSEPAPLLWRPPLGPVHPSYGNQIKSICPLNCSASP